MATNVGKSSFMRLCGVDSDPFPNWATNAGSFGIDYFPEHTVGREIPQRNLTDHSLFIHVFGGQVSVGEMTYSGGSYGLCHLRGGGLISVPATGAFYLYGHLQPAVPNRTGMVEELDAQQYQWGTARYVFKDDPWRRKLTYSYCHIQPRERRVIFEHQLGSVLVVLAGELVCQVKDQEVTMEAGHAAILFDPANLIASTAGVTCVVLKRAD